jgi:hypothetical protein
MREHNLAARTVSLWSYVNSKQHRKRFKNYLYKAKWKPNRPAKHHLRRGAGSDDSGSEHEYAGGAKRVDTTRGFGADDGEEEENEEDEREEEEEEEGKATGRRTEEEESEGGEDGRVLFPRTSVRRLKVWDAYYMRWMADISADREAEERDSIIARLHDDNKRLHRRLKRLQGAKHHQPRRHHFPPQSSPRSTEGQEV